MKFLVIIFLIFNFLYSNENETQTVKPSELELFLFKIGFESLLKDVDLTKEKVNLNDEELKKLAFKVELLMNKMKEDKNLFDNEKEIIEVKRNNSEIEELKNEISILKQELSELKTNSNMNLNKKSNTYKVKYNSINIRQTPSLQGQIIGNATKNQIINIEFCDKYDWCKIEGKEAYISKYLLSL